MGSQHRPSWLWVARGIATQSKSSHGQGVIGPREDENQLRTSLQLLPPASQPTVPRAPMSMVRACSNKYIRDRLDFVRPQLVWEMSSCSEMNETAFFFSVGLVSFFLFPFSGDLDHPHYFPQAPSLIPSSGERRCRSGARSSCTRHPQRSNHCCHHHSRSGTHRSRDERARPCV